MVTLAPRKRLTLLAAALLALGCAGGRPPGPPPEDGGLSPAPVPAPGEVVVGAGQSPARRPPGGDLVVSRWLALDPVDNRGRVPFNPNGPFLRYLLDRSSPPPKEGETVAGDRAEAPWRAVEAKEDGTVEDENGAWFYGEIERPAGDRAEGPPEGSEEVFLAHLDGASAVFVNGAGFPGDVYRLGTGPVPVALRPGMNRLFVVGPRGPWRLRLEPWVAGRSPLLREDATLPDVVEGEASIFAPAGFRIVNPSTSWQSLGLEMEPDPPPPEGDRDRAPVPPLWTGKEMEEVVFSRGVGTVGAKFGVRAWAGREEWPAETFSLEMRKPGEARRETFLSFIDSTAQFYGYLPPSPSDLPPERIGLVLTLHGAGVDALGQARSYSAKQDFRIVAPTNRRPFGFDWQDWGTRDALEAMVHSYWLDGGFGPGPFLTGHSMGGHGTWHLAANMPGDWTAIAPSAGWCSFDTYGGGPRPTTPLTPLWRGCDGGSRTEDLVSNLATVPTFVLHGTKDDNVPLSEAEGMLARIEAAGGKPLHHFQEGAGHWWDGDAAPGADCVDWPEIFEHFRRSSPRPEARTIDFMTADPSLGMGRDGVWIDQPIEYGKPSRVRGTLSESSVVLATENVRLLALGVFFRVIPQRTFTIDGSEIQVPPETTWLRVVRDGTGWAPTGPEIPEEKSARFSGPFKRAFDNGFVLVVGTKGSAEENRESMELARYHAATWWYRANGNAPVVRDTDLLARTGEFAKRNLILYGNADTNAAWETVIPADCPVKARRGALAVGDREWKGDALGAIVVHPRADGEGPGRFLVGAFASTGARGTRVGYGLLPFVSGVGYPDYAVYGEEFLRSGDGGVLAAGWFDHRWALQPGGYLKETPR